MTLLVTGSVSAATIGSVSSFSTSGQDITFDIDDGSRVRLSMLAPDLLRVRFAPNGTFVANVSRAVVKTDWAPAPFTVNEAGNEVTITTSAMSVVVRKSPFVIENRDTQGNLILSDDPARRMEWTGNRTEVFKATQPNEKYVGLGWRTHGLVRNGTRFHMNNVPTYGDPHVFYSGVPFWYGLRGSTIYGLFFDDTSEGMIDVGQTSGSYMSFRNLGGQLDYYYFAGDVMADILNRYTELTGRPYMPPRWSIGYQQCRWSYVPQAQVLEVANELRTRQIPCDVIYLDIDYMPGGRALTFDSAKFPDPAAMISTLHAQGFRVVANISPFLFHHDNPKFNTANASGYLLRHANGNLLSGWHDYWFFVGGADVGNMSWIDFSSTAARNWWAAQHTPFMNYGIDGIWNDLNEPDELGGAWPGDVKYTFDGNPVDHNRTSTQYALLQSQHSYEILANHYPDRRPFVVSRGGFAGVQRYATLWSGDNRAEWNNDYRRNIPMGLSLSISGNPHNGHDIGGFFGYPTQNDAPSGELYARWMQSGVFSPFCRQHKDGFGNLHNPPRPFTEPWQFGQQVEDISRDFISLRYRLMPYLYTLFHEAHASGAPIQRPTLYDFPADAATHAQDHDFMFGPFMLVSPVTSPGVSTWSTYLPAGATWIDWWTDTLHAGGQSVVTATPLERLPIFVRGGAIIPTAPVSQYDGETPVDQLTLELYPVNEESGFTLYEDDGISWDYQQGDFASTSFAMSGSGDSFTFEIAARQGDYVPQPRHYLLRIHRWPGHTLAPALNDLAVTERADLAALEAASEGYFHDTDADLLHVRFPDTGEHTTFTFGGMLIPNVPGDFDKDGDVDMDDFGAFQACLTGSGIPQTDPACAGARLDNDLDVDHEDTLIMIGCLSGANVFGDPDCAD